jgi:hypothetical protein
MSGLAWRGVGVLTGWRVRPIRGSRKFGAIMKLLSLLFACYGNPDYTPVCRAMKASMAAT